MTDTTITKLHPIRLIFQILAFLSTCTVFYFLYQTKILPAHFFSLLAFITFLIITTLIFFSHRHKFAAIILSIIIFINIILFFLLFKYNDYFSKIGQNETYFEKYSLVTLKNSDLTKNTANTIASLGLLTSDPYFETVKQYLTSAESNRPDLLKKPLEETSLKAYDNLLALTTALTNPKTANDKLQAIFLGHTYLDALRDNNEAIYNQLQILADVEIKVTPKHVETTTHASLDTPFTIYLSGIDNRDHTLPFAARSDVNLIIVVNPAKHKILLLNTPRDFYVPLAMNGKLDKLTHAGLYGVNESIHTLENFYGIKFNYYARINFDATSTIIDQLGGVDIHIPYVVNTYHGHRHYEPGNYHLNGDEALDFARERVSISWAGGDRERGRNQEKIITALLQKLQQDKTNLTKLDQIFNSIAKNVQTNFTPDNLKYLVQKQLTNFSNWQIESIDVDGKADITSTYTYPEPKHFVWHPYQDTVDKAKAKLQEYLTQ
ncbi:LCP family protein [Candidatus Saccharibacteria bacterium]|nr:LCP family protein [Candidatus Saccharibacteria bacterium]